MTLTLSHTKRILIYSLGPDCKSIPLTFYSNILTNPVFLALTIQYCLIHSARDGDKTIKSGSAYAQALISSTIPTPNVYNIVVVYPLCFFESPRRRPVNSRKLYYMFLLLT